MDAAALSTVSPEPRGSLRLGATVAGAPLAVEASGVRLVPLAGRARVTLRDADATLANLYLPPDTAVALEKALVGVAVDAVFDGQGGVGLDGQARIDTLTVRRRGANTALVTVPSLVFAMQSAKAPDGRLLGRVEMTGRATVYDPRPGKSNRFEIDRIRLVAEGLDAAGRSAATLALTAGLPGGGVLDVRGTATPAPVGGSLRVRVSRVDLAFWAPYFSLPLDFTGMAETDLTVDATATGARVRGRATLAATTVSDDTRRLAAADRLELIGLDARWPKVRVERVRLARPRATIGRDPEGRLTVMELVESMKRPAAAPGGAAPAPAAKPTPLPADFAIEIGEVSVEDGRLRLDDATVEPPARLRLAPIRLTARDLTWPNRRPVAVTLTAATPGGGTVETQGTIALDPVRFDLRTHLVGIAMAPYHPYLPLAGRVQGHLDGDLAMKGTLGPKMEMGARGGLAFSDLAFADGDGSAALLTVGRLELAGLDYAWPATATVDRVHMRKSWVRMERKGDGSIPLTTILAARRPGRAAHGEGARAHDDTHAVTACDRQPDGARDPLRGRRGQHRGRGGEPDRSGGDRGGAAHRARLHLAGPRAGPGPARDADARGGHHRRPRLARPGRPEPRAARSIRAGVDLAPMQPYLPVRGQAAGKASGDLKIHATLDPLAITARGTASVTDMALGDGGRPLVTATKLQADGIEWTWPASLVVDRVTLDKPWAQIERAADGSFPLRALLDPPPRPTPSSPAAAPAEPRAPVAGAAAPQLDLRVRRTAVRAGSFLILDSTVRPTARDEIRDAALSPATSPGPRASRSTCACAPPPADRRHRRRARAGAARHPAVDLQLILKQMDVATAQAFLPSRGLARGQGRRRAARQGHARLPARGGQRPARGGRHIVGDGAAHARLHQAHGRRRARRRLAAARGPAAAGHRQAVGAGGAGRRREPAPARAAFAGRDPAGRPGAAGPRARARAGGRHRPRDHGEHLGVDEGFIRFVDRGTTPAFAEEASRIAVSGRDLGTARGARGQLTLAGQG